MSMFNRIARAALFIAIATAAMAPARADPNDGIWGGNRGGGNRALAMSYAPITWGTYNVVYTGTTPYTTGGTSPYTYSIQAGTLPTGIALNTSTGVISGTDSTGSAGSTPKG